MTEPDLRTMATVLAAMGEKGIADPQACFEALQWARYSNDDIIRYAGLARQMAWQINHAKRMRERRWATPTEQARNQRKKRKNHAG